MSARGIPAGLPGPYRRTYTLDTRTALGFVKYVAGSDLQAVVFALPSGGTRVMYNAFPYRDYRQVPPRQERARSHITNNPGFVLKQLRAAPGARAVFWTMWGDSATVISHRGTTDADGTYAATEYSVDPFDYDAIDESRRRR